MRRALLRFFSDINWFTPLCALAGYLQTVRTWPGGIFEPAQAALLLLGAVFAYNIVGRAPRRRVAALLAAVAALPVFLYLPVQSKLLWMGISSLWALYYGAQTGLLPASLRHIPWAKPLIVSAAWALGAVLPALPAEQWLQAWPLLLERGAFIFALALAYDLHDAAIDRQLGMRTLANTHTPRQTMRFIYAALLLSATLMCWNVYWGNYHLLTASALCLSLVLTAVIVPYLFKNERFVNWRKVVVDGMMVVQCVIVLTEELL
ncbi:MAG: hypothetical protein J0L99_21980 [Chitinophagales bacterium]|nr:hypothetical protein [Chitinophagales bacterium]